MTGEDGLSAETGAICSVHADGLAWELREEIVNDRTEWTLYVVDAAGIVIKSRSGPLLDVLTMVTAHYDSDHAASIVRSLMDWAERDPGRDVLARAFPPQREPVDVEQIRQSGDLDAWMVLAETILERNPVSKLWRDPKVDGASVTNLAGYRSVGASEEVPGWKLNQPTFEERDAKWRAAARFVAWLTAGFVAATVAIKTSRAAR